MVVSIVYPGSTCEPEVKPLVTNLSCCGQIVELLLLGHGVPLLLTGFVAQDIIDFGQCITADIED